MRKIVLFAILSVLSLPNCLSQGESWFYLRARDSLFDPVFEKVEGQLIYKGNDEKLKAALSSFEIEMFKKTQRKANKKNLKKTFFVIADREELLDELLVATPHLFKSGEVIPPEDKKIYEPNDYGLTSTIGENIGLQVNLDNYDFLGLPEAWYYTTGSRDIIIGISDGGLDTTNIEFKGKTKQIHPSGFAKGHGLGQAIKAGAQGDNGYGIPGICYDCGLFGTNYGNYKHLQELSKLGARVINCSWVSRHSHESVQEDIDQMFDNGTILVASAGNKGWLENKGKMFYYPASYDKVISVSSVMYKHENINDNILVSENDGKYYAENIRGTVGRTMGFKDNDTLKKPRIYPVSTAVLNTEVDLLAPTTGIFLLEHYLLRDEISYYKYQSTSGASPFVSGAIGLMFSLAPCLPVEEVESILKCTSTNIDDIEVNKPFAGKYGAGMLHVGRAVKMVHDLYSENETVRIENQKFSRWDFKLTSYSEKVLIKNQEFTENSTLDLTAKNKVVIAPNTILRPNSRGKIEIKIDASLEQPCELRLREDAE